MHALIIEDEAFIAMMIELTLLENGFDSVDLAATAQEAFDLASGQAPDLITTDVELRDSNGIDAVELIRKFCAPQVVFITGTAQEVHDRMPGETVLVKPFKTSDLCALLGGAA